MTEFNFVEPQKMNKASQAVKDPALLAAWEPNALGPDVTGDFSESHFDHDFSHVAAFTGTERQNLPLFHTTQTIQRAPKNENTDSMPCPNCPEAASTKSTEPATGPGAGPGVEPTSLIEAPQPTGKMPEPGPGATPGAPGGPGAEPGTETAASETSETTPAPVFIVEDAAKEIGPGQMKKSGFLAQLRREVCRAVDEALAGTDRSTQGCPYVHYWFDFYSQKDSAHIERAIHRYAPETKRATTAAEYIPVFTQKARHSAEVWARTGEITGVPEGLPMSLPGMSLLGGIGKTISGIGGLFLKARGANHPVTEEPGAVQEKLGDGAPLESGVRSRMESAFGTDFSHVRAHTDTGAAKLADDLDSRAFTVGKHVAFGVGEYRPGTPIGDALIAHELAHVVQQHGTNDGSAAYNNLEKDADRSALGALSSLWGRKTGAAPHLKSGLRLQRCTKKTAPPTPEKVNAPTTKPGETPAPTPGETPKTTPGMPSVSLGNFRNSGNFSPDNKCKSCKETITLGLYPKYFLNFMELRGDITGHVDNAEYDFKRTRETGIWMLLNGTWIQDHHDDPGTDDDTIDDDEDLTPENNHIYSMDGVGFFNTSDPSQPFAKYLAKSPDITEFVSKGNFVESVNVKVGDGSWTKSSNEFQWHSIVWAEKVGGVWQRKTGKNEIEPNATTIGTGNP